MNAEERIVKRDRMRFVRNSTSSSLCYLGILFDVFYFVNLYQSDVGTYYYQIFIGASIVYNLLFLLVVFLASEAVKNYKQNYSYLLAAVGAMQIVRIFYIPMRAHAAITLVNGEETAVMGNGQFTVQVVFLAISAACLLVSAAVNLFKCKELAEHMKTLEAGKA